MCGVAWGYVRSILALQIELALLALQNAPLRNETDGDVLIRARGTAEQVEWQPRWLEWLSA
jgi:hypothetical protein